MFQNMIKAPKAFEDALVQMAEREAAELDAEALKILVNALSEMAHPSLKREDIEGNAVAILARLSQADIKLQRTNY